MKLVVFDLDGVLLDFCEVHYEALNRAIAEVAGQAFCISRDEHESTYNGRSTWSKLTMLVDQKGLSSGLTETIFIRKQELTALAVSTVSPSTALQSMLLRLRGAGYQTACATNCIRATLDAALTALGIRELFTFTVSNEDVHFPKPHPDIYRLCHQKAGVSPSETVIFEDSPIGLAAARASGSVVVRVPTPASLTEEFVMSALTPITIVIPMAGNGSRFAKAGYADPKPLIPVRGKPMISWVVDNLAVPGAHFVFVIRADYPESCKDHLRSIAPGCDILIVDKVTEGAACTVLLAKHLINNETPLMIANSDQFIEFDVVEFVHSFLVSGADGKISTFDGERNPKWSYAAVKDGFVSEVREKDPFSDHATTGIYAWRRGSDFVRFAEQMIAKNIRVNNEFYTVPVYNEAIAAGLNITISDCAKMWGLGVPEDLNTFLLKYRDPTSFAAIGNRVGTDKCTHHGYDRFYPMFLEKFRAMSGSMLEIGVQDGNSVKLWLEYLPLFHVFGLDIKAEEKGDRFTITRCDQSDQNQIIKQVERLRNETIYFINDDGSHIPEHQLITFNFFFRDLLQPGGVYIIEDVETSYWVRDDCYGYPTRYGYRHPRSALEMFKQLVDDVNWHTMNDDDRRKQDAALSPYFFKETRAMIQSVHFVQNCIVIIKKTDEDHVYTNRDYRYRRYT